MAYQVTKLIAGREYRYHVEGFRDPKTKRVKQRWTYLGRVKGNALTSVRRRSREDVRARILAAVLDLLDKRDVAHVTRHESAHAWLLGLSRCYARSCSARAFIA
jgi:hypothetical protein